MRRWPTTRAETNAWIRCFLQYPKGSLQGGFCPIFGVIPSPSSDCCLIFVLSNKSFIGLVEHFCFLYRFIAMFFSFVLGCFLVNLLLPAYIHHKHSGCFVVVAKKNTRPTPFSVLSRYMGYSTLLNKRNTLMDCSVKSSENIGI